MADIALDPIGLSKALQKAGMPEAQADIIARSQQATVEKLAESKELATKGDLARLETRLVKEFSQEIRSSFRATMLALLTTFVSLVGIIAGFAFWLKPMP